MKAIELVLLVGILSAFLFIFNRTGTFDEETPSRVHMIVTQITYFGIASICGILFRNALHWMNEFVSRERR